MQISLRTTFFLLNKVQIMYKNSKSIIVLYLLLQLHPDLWANFANNKVVWMLDITSTCDKMVNYRLQITEETIILPGCVCATCMVFHECMQPSQPIYLSLFGIN